MRKCFICKKKREISELWSPRKDKFQLVCKMDINVECTAKFGIWLAKKDMQDLAKKDRLETKRIKDKYEKIEDCAAKLSVAHNAFTRARDYDKPCISCYKHIKKVWKNYHAGHFIPYGSKYKYSWLRFDEKNNNGQCANCNTYHNGRQAEYEVGLINRYGQAYVDEIKELKRACDSGEVKPMTKFEMKELTEYYKRETKKIKSEAAA